MRVVTGPVGGTHRWWCPRWAASSSGPAEALRGAGLHARLLEAGAVDAGVVLAGRYVSVGSRRARPSLAMSPVRRIWPATGCTSTSTFSTPGACRRSTVPNPAAWTPKTSRRCLQPSHPAPQARGSPCSTRTPFPTGRYARLLTDTSSAPGYATWEPPPAAPHDDPPSRRASAVEHCAPRSPSAGRATRGWWRHSPPLARAALSRGAPPFRPARCPRPPPPRARRPAGG